MDFAADVLSASCRPEAAQAAIKSKLRGKRLLLESAVTVAPGELRTAAARRSSKRNATERLAMGSRTERRAQLLAAARDITFEQMLSQHKAWQEYYVAAVAAAPAAESLAQRVARMDWVGARVVRVVCERCQAHTSASGFILAETARMLLLISDSRHIWLPKQDACVDIALPDGQTVECDARARVDVQVGRSKAKRRERRKAPP